MSPIQPNAAPIPEGDIPVGSLAGSRRYLRQDLLAGFLVFLIALPLCLGIALASGFPPLAGIITAVVGALVSPWLSNSELTIKGPAAGLIVIVAGCVADFGGDGPLGGFSDADQAAYRAALAIGCAAAAAQVAIAFLRAGVLGEFFPSAVVQGMLAAIGVIIMIKQFPVMLGVTAGGEPLEMLRELPAYLAEANPAIAAIGVVSAAVLFLWPAVTRRLPGLGKLPAPLVVLVLAIAMGSALDLRRDHSYTLREHEHQLGEQHLVAMPDRVFGVFDALTTPDFTALAAPKAWKWVFLFFAIGSLESLLSAKAIDRLDPWRRKTDPDRDLLAVGIGNVGATMIGGLPMISEIVRSRANLDNGARTRFANLWHGLFLLACVALIPTVLHRIPLAALAAMLVFTGFRLAHPKTFASVYRSGLQPFVVFLVTVVAVLGIDLLVGVAVGIVLKLALHLLNGVPLGSLFTPSLEVQPIDGSAERVVVQGPAVFSNWLPFRRQIERSGLEAHRSVVVDLSDATLIDQSVTERLHDLQRDFAREGLELRVEGPAASGPWATPT